MLKHAGRGLLVRFATYYKSIHTLMDQALGAACLRKVAHKGVRCLFEGDGRIIDPDRLFLGDDVYIGRNFFIRATGDIYIGSNTHISRNVTLHTVNHNTNGALLPYDHTVVVKPIRIGSYVWIGMNCAVLPGVSIGDGAIIGMGTVVAKDVPPGAVVVGAGQREVGHRDLGHTRTLLMEERFLRINNKWAAND